MNFKIGDKINNRYELKEYLGGGTYSIVFKSLDTLLDRIVAIKFQEIEFNKNYDIEFQSLIKEARLLSKLNHLNIVKIYDCGIIEDKELLWMTMQYLKGSTLRDIIDANQYITDLQRYEISLQLTQAIDYCHSKHKYYQLDIKPGNTIFDFDNDILTLFDFGSLNTYDYKSKYPFGTPEYLSPELLMGDTSTFMSDIYSLGLYLYELFTYGKNPLKVSSNNIMTNSHLDTIRTCAVCLSNDFHGLNKSEEKLIVLENFKPEIELNNYTNDKKLIQLIKECLVFKPEHRINSEILVKELKQLYKKQKQKQNYDIFISYKSEDYKNAKQVYDLLNSNNHNPFLSKESLPALGESEYMEAIYSAIDDTKHFILVSSKTEYINSKWVKAEWSAFINEKLADRKQGNLVSIITGGLRICDLPLPLRQYEVFLLDNLTYSNILAYFK
jgi:serine/threonine protein kinase